MVHVGGGRFRRGEGTPPYARVLSGVVGRPALWPPWPFAAVGGCPGGMNPSPYGLNRKKDMAVSCGPGMSGPLQDAQFFSGIFGWLYSIFYKYEQNMSPYS